jgi:hypothetical protein
MLKCYPFRLECEPTTPASRHLILSKYFFSVTVAGDEEVRVFDVGEATTGGVDSTGNAAETRYDSREHCIRLLKCHSDRVKRIVSEESPDLFLTIAEVRLRFRLYTTQVSDA